MTQSLDPNKLEAHPLALIVPRPSQDDSRALRAGIKAHGQRDPIVLYEGKVLDGWSRTSACRDLRIKVIAEDEPFSGDNAAARAFVLDKNHARRHLTSGQKRDLVAKLLKADPEVSNRQIASNAKVDDKTVAAVKRTLEATAEIPQLSKTVGADGKSRQSSNSSTRAPTRPVQPTEPDEDDGRADWEQQDADEDDPDWCPGCDWRSDEYPRLPTRRPWDRTKSDNRAESQAIDEIERWLENGDKDAVTKWLASSLASRLDLGDILTSIRAISEEEERKAIEAERRRLKADPPEIPAFMKRDGAAVAADN